eukprot:6529715-Prymnesium_polylepis.1
MLSIVTAMLGGVEGGVLGGAGGRGGGGEGGGGDGGGRGSAGGDGGLRTVQNLQVNGLVSMQLTASHLPEPRPCHLPHNALLSVVEVSQSSYKSDASAESEPITSTP